MAKIWMNLRGRSKKIFARKNQRDDGQVPRR